MAKDLTKLVIYLDRNKIQLVATQLPEIQNLSLEEGIFKDLEIIDKTNFSQTLNNFFDKIRITNGEAIIVLSDGICFVKEFVATQKQKTEEEADTFFSAVPFDAVITKIIEYKGSFKAVAANKELLDELSEILQPRSIRITGVIPAFVVAGMDSRVGLSHEVAEKIIAKADSFQKYDFLGAGPTNESSGPTQVSSKKSPSLVLILIVTFLIGFAVLLVLLLLRTGV